MPQAPTTKTASAPDQRLAYLEQLAQTMIGLQSANQALISRRGAADANETRLIDMHISLNDSEWAKVSVAQILYYTKDVRFKAPTPEELGVIRNMVNGLDAIIGAQSRAQAIIDATSKLVSAFTQSQTS